ncbi:MAG: type II toxin-antitoxin system VapC family toxin [Anaerolineales bacterium]|nr:type II toxin-antitoxin system VapC family toxin [Anaerolineales bacterium]
MRLLLDTHTFLHTFLWFVGGDARLSLLARQLIEDVAQQPLLSIASLWKMAIKISLGKLTLNPSFSDFIPRQLQLNGIQLLGIEFRHTALVATLPFHHRDPFDRMLIAQALSESIPILSQDPTFDAYGITRHW